LKLKNDAFSLDDVDLKILEALQNDSRQTYKNIGKHVGIAHSTVYDRIKRMEKYGIIKKYTTIIDAEKMGQRKILALMTVYTDPKESETVAQRLCKAPEVLEVYTSLSEELLILVKVVAENQESLHAFIANYVAPLPGVLRIRTSIVSRKFKENQFLILDDQKKSTFIKRKRDIREEKKNEHRD
jgi:Lrp/AsnC family transcriptional regulator, leucine-responsive regulatory protein